MNRRSLGRLGVVFALLSLPACRVGGKTSADGQGGSPSSRLVAECASGDRSVGERLVATSRSARLGDDPPSLETTRASLTEACEAGCAPTCLELGRLSGDRQRAHDSNEAACKLGDALGCSLAGALDFDAAAKLCDDGEMLGCAIALEIGLGQDGRDVLERRVKTASARACKLEDARACSIHAWTCCAGLGECDAGALDGASLAARLVREPELLELLAIVQCHAGAPEQADATLAGACSAGVTDACARSCVALPGASVLVREAERDRYDRIATFLLLQLDVTPGWYATLSAMDADELAGFEAILEAFTPPISEPAAKVEIPPALHEQFPGLVESIIRSPQLDEKQIRYWFSRLPDMTEEQRSNLLDSLRKQWWIIPGEPGRTPQAYVDRVRLRRGEFAP